MSFSQQNCIMQTRLSDMHTIYKIYPFQ